MSPQPSLLPGSHPLHTMRDTSLKAFEEVWPTLSRREQAVYFFLMTLREFGDAPPTANELYRAMKTGGVVTESNHVLPRINALVKRGLVRYGPTRKDKYTGRTAHTIELQER